MSRRGCLTLAAILFSSTSLFAADDQPIWREYGLVRTETTQAGNRRVTIYQMKDTTGALAAWEWIRSPQAHPCDMAPFCSTDGKRTVVFNYSTVAVFTGKPSKAEVEGVMQALPDKHETSLPSILTYLPEKNITPNSARYLLGPASVAAFAPELASMNIGFDRDAEGHIAEYRLAKGSQPVRLVIFSYPTPGIARLYAAGFKKRADLHVKRSGVLVGLTLPPAGTEQSDTLLSRLQYTAKVTENETPPPSPIKPLYQLLLNIIYFSVILGALGIGAGLIYAGMRIYRRHYGTLETDESMTTLGLTREQ